MERKDNISKRIASAYRYLKLDGLIVIGGDGSMNILKKIADSEGLKNNWYPQDY